jgi:Zn-dependent protease with chaperone function
VVAVLCRFAADRSIRALEDENPEGAVRSGTWTALFPIFGWGAALSGFHWAGLVAATIPRTWFLLPYVVLFLPLCVMVGAGWAARRRIEGRDEPAGASVRAAIAAGLRRNALVLVPLAFVLALRDSLEVLAALGVPGFARAVTLRQAYPDLDPLLLVVALTFLTYFSPAFFRRALKAAPIPPGDLRTSLEALAARVNLTCRDFLLWRTNGRVRNAMVVGLTGRTRYVILTDGLVSTLSTPQTLAVFAHEAAHAKMRHLPLYFVLSLALILLMQAVDDLAGPVLGEEGMVSLSLLFLAAFWFGMLGWLSRRFERQADVWAADHAGLLEPQAAPVTLPDTGRDIPYGAAQMMFALHRLTARVPVRTLRHGAPRDRIAFLAAYSTDPAVRQAHEQDRRRLLRGIALFVVASIGVTALRVPTAMARGEVRLRVLDGIERAKEARQAGKRGDPAAEARLYGEALDLFEEVRRRGSDRPKDPETTYFAAIASYYAADVRLRHPAPGASSAGDARARFAEALDLVKDVPPLRTGELRVRAHVDLGRLALREEDAASGIAEAKRRLAAARSVAESDYDGKMRRALERLLDADLRLRDPDPAVAAAARKELQAVAASRAEGDEWEDLRHDAADDLDHAPK